MFARGASAEVVPGQDDSPAGHGQAVHHEERLMLTAVRVVAPVAEERIGQARSEEHTSELQSRQSLVCRLLLEKIIGDLPAPAPARATRERDASGGRGIPA